MAWNITMVYTDASDGSPLPGITITDATPQASVLATTDATGTAAITLDVDTSTPQALYMAGTRFSLRDGTVVLYDQQVYDQVTAGLPPYGPDPATWNVRCTITDSADGLPVFGIPLKDLLATVR